ncbi:hypothetical protein E7744_05425 [Citricoccus sp. SGAir0253]|uniref:zf-HC2 domain-containing protein n=1 Tax=Citricoccus sp. SGAir0253 TaxID=2567881 RepID=UPI0010CD1F59|nr:zf-HC2 domain-containing protein [Citricoccus sp. SGAir0253]QCU77700.1 hypothetical protein E7744_05425 [Citricoccus sp. SGAir0253]
MAVFHPRARLDSYVEGALAPGSHQRVRAHLADCADCRREVEQRRRILRAASSLGSTAWARSTAARPSAYPGRPTGPAEPPLLERREGIAGWKVVLGLGAAGLLASGALAGAWVAGDPDASPPEHLLPLAGAPASDEGGDARVSAPGSPRSTDGAATDGAATGGPAAGTGTPDAAVLAPAGAGLPAVAAPSPATSTASPDAASVPAVPGGEGGFTRAGAVDLTPAMVTELRQAGWNVPTLHGLGLRGETTGWQHGEGAAEVVMTLSGDAHSLELHECRSLRDGAAPPSCPVDWTAAPAAGGSSGAAGPAAAAREAGAAASALASVVAEPLADVGGRPVELPVGVEMTVRERADGSWTAAMTTDEASYAVDSDLPVESASRVMSMVVISERSRVLGGTAPDSAAERLARGFDRLLPWSGVTLVAPR